MNHRPRRVKNLDYVWSVLSVDTPLLSLLNDDFYYPLEDQILYNWREMSTLKEEVRDKEVKAFYIGKENMWGF